MAVNEELIAEKLAELEPAWAGRPNIFAAEIAAKDAKALTAKLDDAMPGVRGDAAEALGLIGEASATAKLKGMLNDVEPSVRQAAAVALISLGNDALANEFIKSLSDASVKLVAGAATALGLAKHKPAVPYLLKAYRTEHPRLAAAIATALGQIGDKQAVPWLIEAMKVGLAPVEAAAALGQLGDQSATRPLCDALAHPLPSLRAAAARSLGQLASAGKLDFVQRDRAVTALHKLSSDADERVRFCASLALAGFKEPAGQNQLKQFVASP